MSDQIEVLMPLGAIRKRPELYFGTTHPTAAQLIPLVVADVMGSSAHVRCLSLVSEGVATIAADVDWMQTSESAFGDLWRRFVPPNLRRINSFRSEVLLAAVCSTLRTEGPIGSHCIGESLLAPEANLLEIVGRSGRWLRFSA